MGRGRLFGLMALASLVVLLAGALITVGGVAQADGHDDYLFGGCTPEGCTETKKVTVTTVETEGQYEGLLAIQVSSGRNHAYALTKDGQLFQWGRNDFGQLDTPKLMVWRGNHVRVDQDDSAGRDSDDAWPEMSHAGQQSVDGNRSLVDQESVRWGQVAAGDRHTCAITTENEIHCWGDNGAGQSNIPMRLLLREQDLNVYENEFENELPNPRFIKIVAGGSHTCVLENDGPTVSGTPSGSLVCWGSNEHGQISVPGEPHAAHLAPLPNDPSADEPRGDGGVAATPPNGDLGHDDGDTAGNNFVDVTAGTNHTCAVDTSGVVHCWGDNGYGQTNVPRHLGQPSPLVLSPDGLLTGEFHSIEAGDNYTCAINLEGGALCWGGNNRQQEYPAAGEYTQISAGYWHGCAIWTFDDPPLRGTLATAPEPAYITGGSMEVMGDAWQGPPGTLITLSEMPAGNLDCWGDNGADKATPPTYIERPGRSTKTTTRITTTTTTTSRGGLVVDESEETETETDVQKRTHDVTISNLRWNQVSAGATFTCGILDLSAGQLPTSPPTSPDDAVLFSATSAVGEGLVACFGYGEAANVPLEHKLTLQASTTSTETVTGSKKCEPCHGDIPNGYGRIYGRTNDDGQLEFAFKVIRNDAPDLILRPDFRYVPSSGALTVGRWYYSDMMNVHVYQDGTASNPECSLVNMPVGRIAVRLLPSGHMEIGLMTPDGMVRPNVPLDHNRVPTPHQPNKWWSSGRIQWHHAD